MADNDYQRLSIGRDHAAYRAVGAIDAAICYCRQGDTKMALSILLNARSSYNDADQALQNYFQSGSKKGNASDGNRTAAA